MNPEITDFYRFTVDDFELRDYKFGPKVEKIPVAV
jgi:thymidylate synthase